MKKTIKPITIAVITGCLLAAVSTASVMAASPSDEVLLRQAKVREVIRTVVRKMIDFRKEMPLSEAQKSQIRGIVETYHPDIHSVASEMKTAREAFRDTADKAPDSEETMAAVESIGEAAKNKARLAAKIRAGIRPLMTDEQKQYLESAQEEIGLKVDAVIATFE